MLFQSRRAKSCDFSIASLNPKLWLDASDSSTIILNGADVSQWNDKSGNNNNATQGTVSAQPLYNLASINGRNTLEFDGNNFIDLNSALANTNDFTFYLLWENDISYTTSYGPEVLIGATTAPLPRSIFAFGAISASVGTLSLITGTGVDEESYLNTTLIPNIRVYKFKLSGSTVTISLNGVDQIVLETGGGIRDLTKLQRIGALHTQTAKLFGNMGEIIYFNSALSSEDDLNITNYLMAKWGI